MLPQFSSTAIIRQRGQLTIPDGFRELVKWVFPGSVVSLTRGAADEIIIKPHVTKDVNFFSWNKLWRSIELARSQRGNYTGSLSKFIEKDRQVRR